VKAEIVLLRRAVAPRSGNIRRKENEEKEKNELSCGALPGGQ